MLRPGVLLLGALVDGVLLRDALLFGALMDGVLPSALLLGCRVPLWHKTKSFVR